MEKFPRAQPGQIAGMHVPGKGLLISKAFADVLNRAAAELKRLGKVSVVPPLRWEESTSGRRFACDLNPEIWAKLSGPGDPYSFVQQAYNPATNTWSDMAGGRTGDNCYESRGLAGLAGKILLIEFVPSAGDWRFQWVGYGPVECLWTFIVLDHCTDALLPGALVTLSQGGVEIASCTTDGVVASATRVNTGSNFTGLPTVTVTGDGSGATVVPIMEVGALTRTANGTGYTPGTHTDGTFTGGSGTGATFSYFVDGSGAVSGSATLTNRGEGYTSQPTPVYGAGGSGATGTSTIRLKSLVVTDGGGGYSFATLSISGGGGSGATGTAAVQAQCVLDVPVGDYGYEVAPPVDSPYLGASGTLAHTCGQTTTFSLDVDDEDFLCLPGCFLVGCNILPKVIFITWAIPFAFRADTTLTQGPDLFGATTWYSEDLTEGSIIYRYELQCTGLARRLQDEDGNWETTGVGMGSFSLATGTCDPLNVVSRFGWVIAG